jgi:hypothetical protein
MPEFTDAAAPEGSPLKRAENQKAGMGIGVSRTTAEAVA